MNNIDISTPSKFALSNNYSIGLKESVLELPEIPTIERCMDHREDQSSDSEIKRYRDAIGDFRHHKQSL